MKNQSKKLWFKAKHYGYGWYPSTWEGWLTLGIYIILLAVGEFLYIARLKTSPSLSMTVLFISYILSLTSTLIFISAKKGEKPGWHWKK